MKIYFLFVYIISSFIFTSAIHEFFLRERAFTQRHTKKELEKFFHESYKTTLRNEFQWEWETARGNDSEVKKSRCEIAGTRFLGQSCINLKVLDVAPVIDETVTFSEPIDGNENVISDVLICKIRCVRSAPSSQPSPHREAAEPENQTNVWRFLIISVVRNTTAEEVTSQSQESDEQPTETENEQMEIDEGDELNLEDEETESEKSLSAEPMDTDSEISQLNQSAAITGEADLNGGQYNQPDGETSNDRTTRIHLLEELISELRQAAQQPGTSQRQEQQQQPEQEQKEDLEEKDTIFYVREVPFRCGTYSMYIFDRVKTMTQIVGEDSRRTRSPIYIVGAVV